ncbi:membrane protein insertase YidC [bacterium]|nr:membrane protein insertase YidC [candidate division CSSED10-310 bacterium]
MEKRFFLALSLSIAVFLLWSAYFGPPATSPAPTTDAVDIPASETPGTASLFGKTGTVESEPDNQPTANWSADPGIVDSSASDDPSAEPIPIPQQRTLTVDTPLYSAQIDTLGGHIVSWKLKDHMDKHGDVIEMIPDPPPSFYPGDVRINNQTVFNHIVFRADTETDTLTVDPENHASVTLTATLPSGEQVEKTFVFNGDTYLLNLNLLLKNNGTNSLDGRIDYLLPERLILKTGKHVPNKYIRSGPVIWVGRDRELPKAKKVTTRMDYPNAQWAAYQEDYFFAGIIPIQPATGFVEPVSIGYLPDTEPTAITGITIATRMINPGDAVSQTIHMVIGPKKYDQLEQLNLGIENIVDFGWIEILGKIFYVIIMFSVTYLKNYGLSIILITICVKLILFPLSQKQMNSMKKMQTIQPQMKAIQEKYRKEPQKQQQELSRLYKEHGVNPMGGCLPMFIQFPVFIALYQVLMNLIEMRGAGFLWVRDLSQPNIPLVILMGITMIVQQKMTPTTGDPRQARMMMFLPIIFTAMFWSFPSGLVLYWLTNNVLTIGQQMLMNRSQAVPGGEAGEKKLKARTRRKLENQ